MTDTNLLKRINSPKDLKERLKRDKIPCRIPYKSSGYFMLQKYPVLKLFLKEGKISFTRINDFMYEEVLPENGEPTSYTFNKILLELSKLKFQNYPVCVSKIELRSYIESRSHLNKLFLRRPIENFLYSVNDKFYYTNSYYKENGLYVTDFVNILDERVILHTAISRLTSYCYDLLDNPKFVDAKILPLTKRQSRKFVKHLKRSI